MSGLVLVIMPSKIANELSREQICSDFGDEMINANNNVFFEARIDTAKLRPNDVSRFLGNHPEARTTMVRKLIQHYNELHKKVFSVFKITKRDIEADEHDETGLFKDIINFKKQDLLDEYGDVKLVLRFHGEDEESWTIREYFENPEGGSDLVEPLILEALLRNPNHAALKDKDGYLLFEGPTDQTRTKAGGSENEEDEGGEEGEEEGEEQDEEEDKEEDEGEEEEEEEEEEEGEDDDDEELAEPAQAPRRRKTRARGLTTATVCFIPGCTSQTLRADARNTDIITHLIEAHGLRITKAMRSHGGNEFAKRMTRNRIARPWLRQRGVDPNTVKPFEDPTGETDEEEE
ncbi:hypothetical protein KC360_g7886 [Hortaea werneckii]|nr:hypothetical protein KC361_g8186 [Hortaea werneckii]KAI6879556.1 hypothetical protein KC325_g7877 [Hortaea werneckii]KAI6987584.1 hypothetical protein KC359_g8199 [Hortaea werneckii]KAI7141668.1 hypothetical protein KC344_g7813 [Hortaea werneckii]KAI7168751.1 hypothetical protein KC360_g7886 [Hortaea werneckii]